MDSEQKSAVTRAPGDSRDNGKNGKRVFLKCIKMHIIMNNIKKIRKNIHFPLDR